MTLSSDTIQRLIAAASSAREKAYAPYSGYKVGAALLTDDGEVVTGCNVENASYGLSVCAERHAVGAAVVKGARHFRAIAVVTDSTPPAPPCGACRQVLAEFGEYPVILANSGEERRLTSIAELLPEAFTAAMLKRSDEAPE
jgi:cytidine deaminase